MILQTHHNVSPDLITELGAYDVFTYGANQAWRHGSGAACTALKWGAVYGEGPFRGQTYGICTKDRQIKTMPLDEIAKEIAAFVKTAAAFPDQRFLVTQIGCGLAALTPAQIAPLFFAYSLPSNIHLPAVFWAIYDQAQNDLDNGRAAS